MIPSVVAAEVTGALGGLLVTGFGPSNPALTHVIDDFLAQPENLAKGPYLSIALPFQPAAVNGAAAGPPTSARRTIATPATHTVDSAAIPRRLRFSDDLKPDESTIHLPLIQCRECHVSGWGAVKRPVEQRLERDLRVFFNRWRSGPGRISRNCCWPRRRDEGKYL